jgi:hypothetical protein
MVPELDKQRPPKTGELESKASIIILEGELKLPLSYVKQRLKDPDYKGKRPDTSVLPWGYEYIY